MDASQQTTSQPAPKLGAVARLAYFAMVAAALVLTVTGVGTFLTGHAPMTHYILMAHVSAAPVFAIGLAFVALTWSARNRFSCDGTVSCPITKTLLWLILLCGLIVMLTGVIPMTPVFGTQGQHFLYLTHRYSGITMACLLVLHLIRFATSR